CIKYRNMSMNSVGGGFSEKDLCAVGVCLRPFGGNLVKRCMVHRRTGGRQHPAKRKRRTGKRLPRSDKCLPGSDKRLPGSDKRLPGSDKRLPGSDKRLLGPGLLSLPLNRCPVLVLFDFPCLTHPPDL